MKINILTDADKVKKAIANAGRSKIKWVVGGTLKQITKEATPYMRQQMLSKMAAPVNITKRAIDSINYTAWRDDVLYSAVYVVGNRNRIVGVPRRNAGRADRRLRIGLNEANTPEEYLRPFFEGGSRKLKPFETLMKMRGYLPDGYHLLPTRTYRNASNDLRRRWANIILSDLSATPSGVGDRSPNEPGKIYVVLPGQVNAYLPMLRPGIYRKVRGRFQMMLAYMSPRQYRKRMDFHAEAISFVKMRFNPLFKQKYRIAMRLGKYTTGMVTR